MKIVVLDGFTLNPGDLSWNPFTALGDCQIYDRTTPEELIARAGSAEIVLTNKVELGKSVIERLPRLRYIGVLATGTNIVDLEMARARGIPVTNVPNYGTKSVAQTTIALLLEIAHHVGHHAHSVRQGRWSGNIDWCYWDYPLVELDKLTLGIIGLGRIGQSVASLGAALGMQILASSRRATSPLPFVAMVELQALLRQSDVVSLHCPLTSETRLLINRERLSWMKPGAFLLNASRGQLIDEPALAEALNQGKLAGAGLDVLSVEPPPPDHPLLRARNCLITPHFAWGTRAARQRLMNIAAENIRSFLKGTPENLVNAKQG